MLEFTFTELAKGHMQRNGYSAEEMLGTIPEMLSTSDPAGAVEQIDRAYKDIGGGWRDSKGQTLNVTDMTLTYPGDPPRVLIAEASLREERILFFNGAWIVVLSPDSAFRVARID
jgi:hypothetical protein